MSAQDLHQASRKMKTYAVAWIHPNRKLSTRVDALGHTRPTWNDKFVFRVDEEFLYSETSAINIDIYASHWFRDILVGTVRVLVGSVAPPRPNKSLPRIGNRFLALQVRRPSGRPQGLLNVGISILDNSMRSMPIYAGSSAVGYRDLMGAAEYNQQRKGSNDEDSSISSLYASIPNKKEFHLPWMPPTPQLRRTKSDFGEGSSVVGSTYKVISKASSTLSSLDINYRNNRLNQPSSRGSRSEIGGFPKIAGKPNPIIPLPPGAKFLHGSETSSSNELIPSVTKRPLITDSELGPSASEVAAVTVAKFRQLNYKNEESDKDTMGSWSLESSSIEGLQSKLGRWQQVEDVSLVQSMDRGSVMEKGIGGDGGFTCMTNFCGLKFLIVCGGAAAAKRKKTIGTSTKHKGRNKRSISI
ncbi:hypothetical protein LINPERPRIM_LOCUS5443 [Linum perenne]